MSQVVGQVFKSRIPTLGDDASIEEALRVYHYGVDNFTTQAIPDDSIEGNFRSLDTRIDTIESIIDTVDNGLVKLVSLAADPNIITAETITTVPLTVRAIASQTSVLQQWQNSSNTQIASIATSGYFATAGYVSVGSTTPVATTAININIVNAANKGIVVRGTSSQTANLQEWQNNAGTILSSVNSSGAFSAASVATTGNISSGGSISATTSLSAASASITDISSSGSIILTSSQTLDSFRVRNIRASTSQPTGGNDGDVWFVYV